jgi:hypothetical protein
VNAPLVPLALGLCLLGGELALPLVEGLDVRALLLEKLSNLRR